MFIGIKVLEKYEELIDLTFPVWNFIVEMDDIWEKNQGKRMPEELNMVIRYRRQANMPKDRIKYHNSKESDLSSLNKPKTPKNADPVKVDSVKRHLPHYDIEAILNTKRENCKKNLNSEKSELMSKIDAEIGIVRPTASPMKKDNNKIDIDILLGKRDSPNELLMEERYEETKKTLKNEMEELSQSGIVRAYSTKSDNLDDLLD